MSLSLSRPLPLRLSRSFPLCRSSHTQAQITPPRRKGRIPRVDPKTQSLLPPEKLHALISLYHQSEDFITMENLGQRIDAAFSSPKQLTNSISQSALEDIVKKHRATQRLSPWNLEPPTYAQEKRSSWSSSIANREKQVIDALCGTETIGSGSPTLPGYGTLMEARKQKQEKLDGGVV